MKLGLRDKVVVITGGATGIGFACALRFLAEGCKVVICGRNYRKLAEAQTLAQEKGYELITFVADVSKGKDMNASSYAAIIPAAGCGAYAASKAAILNLTRTLAAEFAPFNIRVNAYLPGVITTEMNQDRIEKAQDRLKDQIALHRFAAAEEIAPGIVFLASSAASYITGTSIELSGGKFCVQNPQVPWQAK